MVIMHVRKLNVWTYISLFCCVSLALDAKFIGEFTNVECENLNPELLLFIDCQVNRTFYKPGALYVDFELAEDLSNLTVTFNLQLMFHKKYDNYFTLDLDVCETDVVQRNWIMRLILVELRRTSNFPLNCPWIKHKRHIVNGFKIDPNAVPKYLPQSPFKAVITLFANKRKTVRFSANGKVGQKY